MKIIVKAKTRAKENKVERVGQPTLGFGLKLSTDGSPDHFALQNDLGRDEKEGKKEMVVYKVSVKEAPVAGRANEAIVRALAEYFEVGRARVRLVSGQTSKQKIFEIEIDN